MKTDLANFLRRTAEKIVPTPPQATPLPFHLEVSPRGNGRGEFFVTLIANSDGVVEVHDENGTHYKRVLSGDKLTFELKTK